MKFPGWSSPIVSSPLKAKFPAADLKSIRHVIDYHWRRSRARAISAGRPSWTPPPSQPADRPVDYRPEQKQNRHRRDRTDQAVGPEHLHLAAGADHRQPERILGPVTKHQR